MAHLLDSTHRRFIATETAICTMASGVLPATVMWFTAGPFPLALWGVDGFAMTIVKNTVGMAFFMSLLMTLGMRLRLRKAGGPAIAGGRAAHPALGLIPSSVMWRALAIVLLTLAIVAPLAIAFAWALDLDPVGRTGFVLFNGFHGAIVGALLTPIILLGVMSDEAIFSRPPTLS